MSKFDSILIAGCGNMAGAMLQGWLAAGLAPQRFTVADPALDAAPDGVRLLKAIPAAGAFDTIVLGVKPQLLDTVAAPLEAISNDAVVISMLAGVELEVLADKFPAARGVVRIMPNLSASLGKSPIAMAAQGLDDADKDGLQAFLSSLGTPEWVVEEEFDLVTALAGSGPAFVYRFIDALAVAASGLGLPREKAERLALATVEGAAALAAASPYDPADLARRVASPGGTTQAGLDALDRGDALVTLLEQTLRAARDRSADMAEQARNG